MFFTASLLIYLTITVLVIVFIVWFIKTLNEMKQSLLRIEMKLMGYDPMADNSVEDKRLE
jgi:hypothetical protein